MKEQCLKDREQKQRFHASYEVLIPQAEKVEGTDEQINQVEPEGAVEMKWVKDGRRTLFSFSLQLGHWCLLLRESCEASLGEEQVKRVAVSLVEDRHQHRAVVVMEEGPALTSESHHV